MVTVNKKVERTPGLRIAASRSGRTTAIRDHRRRLPIDGLLLLAVLAIYTFTHPSFAAECTRQNQCQPCAGGAGVCSSHGAGDFYCKTSFQTIGGSGCSPTSGSCTTTAGRDGTCGGGQCGDHYTCTANSVPESNMPEMSDFLVPAFFLAALGIAYAVRLRTVRRK